MHCLHPLQPLLHHKFLKICEKSSIHSKVSVEVDHHLSPVNLFVFGWLVDNQLVAAITKSQKFLEITRKHQFCSILFKKIKSCPAT